MFFYYGMAVNCSRKHSHPTLLQKNNNNKQETFRDTVSRKQEARSLELKPEPSASMRLLSQCGLSTPGLLRNMAA